jgi:hypothetical protein
VRLTTFAPSLPSGARWDLVTGESPDLRTQNPKAGTTDERGDFADGQLVYLAQPGRSDWVFVRARYPSTPLAPPSPLENLTDTLGRFRVAPERWLPASTGITRLAMGAVLVSPVPSRAVGYLALQPYLRTLRPEPEGTEELLYQINRPVISTVVPGLKINRIMKWSVSTSQAIQIGPGQSSTLRSETFDCRLELDLSTDVARAEALPASDLVAIWTELETSAILLSQKGEFA